MPRKNNASHPEDSHEDNPKVRVSGVDFHEINASTTQDRPVSLSALNSTSNEKVEQHGEEKIPAHYKNKQENDPEIHVAGPSFVDWKRTGTAQNENLNRKIENRA